MYPEARQFGARRQCGVLGTEAKRAHQYAAWPWSIRVQRKNYKENGGYSHPPSAARRATGVQPEHYSSRPMDGYAAMACRIAITVSGGPGRAGLREAQSVAKRSLIRLANSRA